MDKSYFYSFLSKTIKHCSCLSLRWSFYLGADCSSAPDPIPSSGWGSSVTAGRCFGCAAESCFNSASGSGCVGCRTWELGVRFSDPTPALAGWWDHLFSWCRLVGRNSCCQEPSVSTTILNMAPSGGQSWWFKWR